jgi:hypothetical protein
MKNFCTQTQKNICPARRSEHDRKKGVHMLRKNQSSASIKVAIAVRSPWMMQTPPGLPRLHQEHPVCRAYGTYGTHGTHNTHGTKTSIALNTSCASASAAVDIHTVKSRESS